MKPSHLAVILVLAAVGGVVALGGVTHKASTPPRVQAARPETPAAVEAPPFPEMDGPLWNLTSVDARMRIPQGWSIGRVKNDERLLRNPEDPLDGNMNLLLLPNAFGLSIEELLTENVDELAVNPDLHLEDRQEIRVMGRKVLRFDYNGKPRTGGDPVRFVAVVWTRGRFQVVLTMTVRATAWPDVAQEVDAAFESLQIRWPMPRAK